MNQPSLEERKLFWLYGYSQECFSTVIDGCEYLLRNGNGLNKGVFRIISAGLVATYARPFTKCHGVGNLDEKLIPLADLKIHKHILDMRHKAVAHLDAINFQADDGKFGNINQVRLKTTNQGFAFSAITVSLSADLLADMKKIATLLKQKVDYHVDKFIRKYVEGNPLKPGEYILNIDPTKPELFLPVKPLVEFKGPASVG